MLFDGRAFECNMHKVERDEMITESSGHGYIGSYMLSIRLSIAPAELTMIESDSLFKIIGKTVEDFMKSREA